MASYTENLNLLKKNPLTDGSDTFNIETMLNENWDKIDAFARVAANPAELWVWEKSDYTAAAYTLSDALGRKTLLYKSGGRYGNSFYVTFQYSDSVTVAKDGTVSLATYNTTNVYKSSASMGKGYEPLVGKYFKYISFSSVDTDFRDDPNVYYWPPGVSPDATTAEYLYVTGLQKVTGHREYTTLLEYLVSLNPTAYPESGFVDDYFYTRLGRIGGAARIETGSYVGTGTYGASNPNSLTFGFAPKIVIARKAEDRGYYSELIQGSLLWIDGLTESTSVYGGRTENVKNYSMNGKTLSWYATDGEGYQSNENGIVYAYIAIG